LRQQFAVRVSDNFRSVRELCPIHSVKNSYDEAKRPSFHKIAELFYNEFTTVLMFGTLALQELTSDTNTPNNINLKRVHASLCEVVDLQCDCNRILFPTKCTIFVYTLVLVYKNVFTS
jgi:hypothetical protein